MQTYYIVLVREYIKILSFSQIHGVGNGEKSGLTFVGQRVANYHAIDVQL